MTTYFGTVIFAVSCFSVILSSASGENDPNSIVKVTQKQFDAWKCSKVCTNLALKKKLADVCVKLWNELHVKTGEQGMYSYDEKTVRRNAKCLENSTVDLEDDEGRTVASKRKMGLCYFSPGTPRCVSKSVGSENTIYYYDYDSMSNHCSRPREMEYTLSANLLELKSICTDPDLRYYLSDVCVSLGSTQFNLSNDSYDIATVRKKAKCSENSKVYLKNNLGQAKEFTKPMGLCYLDTDIAKCVTKGQKDDSIIYYSYDSTKNVCSRPQPMYFHFKPIPRVKAEAPSKGGWLSFLSCFNFFWGSS